MPRGEEGKEGDGGSGAGPAGSYVPLALALPLVLPLALPVLVVAGLDLAMYAPIRNAMPTTNETMARTWWWP